MRIPESRIRVVLALITPPLLIGMAVLTLAVESPLAVPIVFGGLGTVLAAIVLFDFPLAIATDETGLTRVCLMRHQIVSYSEISVIIRPRRRGLLLIRTNRKRAVLIDRILEADERNHLIDLGDQYGFQVEL